MGTTMARQRNETTLVYTGAVCSMVPTITTDCANADGMRFAACLVRMRRGSQHCEIVTRCTPFTEAHTRHAILDCRAAGVGRVESLPALLSTLILRENKLTTFDPVIVGGESTLTDMWVLWRATGDCYECLIVGLTLVIFDSNLSGNSISSIEDIRLPAGVGYLDLGRNEIKTLVLHDGLAGLHGLNVEGHLTRHVVMRNTRPLSLRELKIEVQSIQDIDIPSSLSRIDMTVHTSLVNFVPPPSIQRLATHTFDMMLGSMDLSQSTNISALLFKSDVRTLDGVKLPPRPENIDLNTRYDCIVIRESDLPVLRRAIVRASGESQRPCFHVLAPQARRESVIVEGGTKMDVLVVDDAVFEGYFFTNKSVVAATTRSMGSRRHLALARSKTIDGTSHETHPRPVLVGIVCVALVVFLTTFVLGRRTRHRRTLVRS